MNYLNLFPQRLFSATALTAITLGLSGLTGGSAQALDFGTSWDTNCLGGVGPESCSLQNHFDSQTVSGGIDAVADQTGYEWFTNTATGNATGTFMFEVAGFAPHNEFGIYNKSGSKIDLFGGINDAGDSVTVNFLSGGKVSRTTQQLEPGPINAPVWNMFEDFGNEFGFYLTNKNGETFYSQSSKNDGGYQQAVVYQGDDETVMELPGRAAGTFTDNEFIIAFEDLFRGGSSDSDFNDLVVMMESIEPADVPEPSMLLGLGVLGASFWSVRRRRSRS
ncbi:DUF4114 domain-containing protein [Roseofilum sp. BLCC_M91]|uniref:DUF4114 domain-containing protein n=1 Tax=Roseofilum halophilum BLCC-M91 TaxID=3022259 RepID=A0ABT7BJJ4_9CYAN|nr:DUF4114 domain-containing protein [Roseofilum halophilum]MDJ1179353.1 DUF4114 domain-containing protein [Roseofilum halophilum BLCC-M91]